MPDNGTTPHPTKADTIIYKIMQPVKIMKMKI